jgi:hypothetical protein
MQQDYSLPTGEPIVVVFTAGTWTEAVVVRGLLESSGIPSPALGDGNPSTMQDLFPTLNRIEIYALESQAERARKVIAEYLEGAGWASDDDEDNEDSNES